MSTFNSSSTGRSRFALLVWIIPYTLCTCIGCGFSATGHNLDGKRLFEQGQYGAALQKFQHAASTDPSNPDAYYNMASTYHRMGTSTGDAKSPYYTQAEDLYNQCLNLDSNHIDCYRGLAVLLIETNRKDRAYTLLKNWATANPSNADAAVELARLFHEDGKVETSRQYLEHAVQLDQRNSRAWRALAHLREEQGDIGQALANYQRSYQLNGFQPDVATKIARLQQNVNSRTTVMPGETRWAKPTVPSSRY